MRFFIALEIPEESRQEIGLVQEKIRELVPHTRLTNPDKLHLTIAFIGEQPEEIKKDLIEVIKNSVWDLKPFQVTPAYIDGFPNLHRASIFWLGVKGEIDKLFTVREKIKDGLKNLSVNIDERRYIPHVAIAKTRNFRITPFQENQFQQFMLEKNFEPINITSIKLFESIPNEGFHQHNTLANIQLKPLTEENGQFSN